MDCQSVQTAPGLTLRAGGQTGRQPFSVLDTAGSAEKTRPVAETRRLSRSPPPLVSETRRDSASPGALPRELSSLRLRCETSRASGFELAPLDKGESGPPASAPAALILGLNQFVFRSSLSRFSVSRPHQPAFAGGKNRWCPLKTTPTAPPCFTGFWGEGRETETEQRTKKRP